MAEGMESAVPAVTETDDNSDVDVNRKAVECVLAYIQNAESVDWAVVAQFASAAMLLRQRNRKSRVWVRDLLLPRNEFGEFHHLVRDMRLGDGQDFFDYFRMSRERFDHLLSLVGPLIERQNTSFRQSISPAERLCITLRYLAHGSSQRICAMNYRIGSSTASGIIRDTCEAIRQALETIYLPTPSKDALAKIADDYWKLWNFPNCMGALDGKHVVIQAPPKCGSLYYNYKGTHSIVLLATCDANYKFIMIDVGECGSRSDGGIFRNSDVHEMLQKETNLPEPKNLPNTSAQMPYVIIGDEAFPLMNSLMRPYPGRQLPLSCKVFNYRLSRARRTIENAFGILSSRWRIYRQPINASLETVNAIVHATVCLHNYLSMSDRAQGHHAYCPPGYSDYEDVSGNVHPGQWRQSVSDNEALRHIPRTGSNMHARSAKELRDKLAEYFCSTAGELSWQYSVVLRGSQRK
ncbi:uncharacterized protein LOC135389557 [Ornithodoros turicata]|uniref:uncharacterized protein LOC135389557 n=1 Tax=Ornithodoros turicata TaxID=34597 RepID=UPI003139120F